MLSLRQLAEQMSANVWFKNPFNILKPKRTKPMSQISGDAKRMFAWARHYHILNNMPCSIEKLTSLEMGELRLMASLFKAYDYEDMLSYDREMLIQFICGHQNDITQYVTLPPLPFGSFPELS